MRNVFALLLLTFLSLGVIKTSPQYIKDQAESKNNINNTRKSFLTLFSSQKDNLENSSKNINLLKEAINESLNIEFESNDSEDFIKPEEAINELLIQTKKSIDSIDKHKFFTKKLNNLYM